MRTAMLLLVLAVSPAGAPGRTSHNPPPCQRSTQADGRDRAPRDGVARGKRTDLRHRRLGDFNLPGADRAYA